MTCIRIVCLNGLTPTSPGLQITLSDNGPIQEDVFFLLIASDGRSGCVVPQGAEGSAQLLQRLQELPGFDNGAIIKAMGSTSNAKICLLEAALMPGFVMSSVQLFPGIRL